MGGNLVFCPNEVLRGDGDIPEVGTPATPLQPATTPNIKDTSVTYPNPALDRSIRFINRAYYFTHRRLHHLECFVYYKLFSSTHA